MARRKPLTDTAIRQSKPRPKPYKLFDGGGLFVLVNRDGSRYWRFRYTFARREKLLSMGVYPHVSLAQARERRDEARKLLAQGIDPSAKRKAEKAAGQDTFEALAQEWFERHLSGKAPGHRDKIVRRLERDVFPWLGSKPVAEITAPDVLTVVRRIADRGALETAHRAQQNIGQVIRYAVATGRGVHDPTASLRGALPPAEKGHFPAPTEPAAVTALLRSLDGFKGTFTVSCALKLAPLVFVRPGELRSMRWADVDLTAAEWRFTVPKTKTEHLVPLSAQAVAILREIEPLTGRSVYVFPSARTNDRPLSDAALNAALRRLGIEKVHFTVHGWRAIARTLLHERLNWRPEVIEHQLAHRVPDALGAAYNRTKFLDERRKMMTQWSDYLDGLKRGAQVVPLRRA
ncbi:MAG: integrase arm-type DNA-binding domain-containing protein [Gammaproteobacteria bacterium]|nr:integrase arm-type DNA-binding domain-containing protein [Gammaproteobacteria bacterium]